MSVYRSTFALTKLFGIARAQGGLENNENTWARYPFFGGLSQDIKRVGYSTRLTFSEDLPSAQVPPCLDNVDTVLSSNLLAFNAFIHRVIGAPHDDEGVFPIVITHNFTKAEIDITAPSLDCVALIERAIGREHGQCYRDLAWNTFAILRSTADDLGAIYLLNDAHGTITALCNASSLQIQIDEKPNQDG